MRQLLLVQQPPEVAEATEGASTSARAPGGAPAAAAAAALPLELQLLEAFPGPLVSVNKDKVRGWVVGGWGPQSLL